LAGGGRCDDAIVVLRACLPAGINHDGCALAVELLASDARPFVEAALDHHLELVQFSTDYNRCRAGATYLARLVARADPPDLQTRLIAAVAVTRPYEDRPASINAQWRLRRVTEVLRELAGAYPELGTASPMVARLDDWARALGDDRGLLGAAAAALAHESLE